MKKIIIIAFLISTLFHATNCKHIFGGGAAFLSSNAAVIETVAPPEFIPAEGNYTTSQYIAITCATPGAVIRYTTDGTIPSINNGTAYTGTIFVSSAIPVIIQAVAYKPGMYESPISYVYAFYTVTPAMQVSAPLITPISGNYSSSPVIVTIRSNTTGASIRYTTDGSNPTASIGTVYSGVFSFAITSGNNVVKAIAYKSGMTDSVVSSVTYYYNSKIVFESSRIAGKYQVFIMNRDGSYQTQITNTSFNAVYPGFSPDGTKVVFCCDEGNSNDGIYTISINGNSLRKIYSGNAAWPDWSPDGTKIVFQSNQSGTSQIYTINIDGSGFTRLTSNSFPDEYSRRSRDGTKITFDSDRAAGIHQIYTMNADGSNQVRVHTINGWRPSFSPDGLWIVFNYGVWDIIKMRSNDGSNQTPLSDSSGWDVSPSWSPDGTKIIFHSTRTGNEEIFIMNASDGSSHQNLTNNPGGDKHPRWSHY